MVESDNSCRLIIPWMKMKFSKWLLIGRMRDWEKFSWLNACLAYMKSLGSNPSPGCSRQSGTCQHLENESKGIRSSRSSLATYWVWNQPRMRKTLSNKGRREERREGGRAGGRTGKRITPPKWFLWKTTSQNNDRDTSSEAKQNSKK